MKNISLLLALSLVYATSGAQGYSVFDLDFNSEYADYAPVIYGDGLVFCSERKSDIFVTSIDSVESFTANLYFVEFGEKETRPQLMASNLASYLHEGPASFSADGQTMYFTSNLDRKAILKAENHLGIFVSKLVDGKWSEPQTFTFNSEDNDFDVAHPVISPDGKRLYFSSNMRGSKGEADLFYCDKVGDSWSQPVNLGKKVNTRGHELFPSLGSDGRLYFSSNGRDVGNGLDIYYTMESHGEWLTPVKLEEPINSQYDDYGFTVDESGEEGYFSSSRSGSHNVHRFEAAYPVFGGCDEIQQPIFCYYLEEQEIMYNDTLPFQYYWDFGDGTTADGLSADHCFPGLGSYDISLNVIDTITNLHYAKVSEYHLDIEKLNQPFITSPDTVLAGSEFKLSSHETELRDFDVDQFYWDTGDGEKFKGDSITYSFTEPGTYYVVLGATSMPVDGQIRQTCAYKPIEVVDNQEIIDNLMAERSTMSNMTRIFDTEVPNSYVPEALPERGPTMFYVQITESEEQLALNDSYFEKISYEITERYNDEDSLYKYSVGAADEITKLYQIYRELLDSGYTKTLVREREIEVFDEEVVRRGMYMPDSVRMEMNRQINKFADINFASNSTEINGKSFANLDRVVDVMKAEEAIRLRIKAFTDNTGTNDFNLELSELRAAAVVEYLVSQGIDAERLIPLGFGNTQPKVSNDSEEGRAANRRVEFDIVAEVEPE